MDLGIGGQQIRAQESRPTPDSQELALPPLTVLEIKEAKERLAALGYWIEPLAKPGDQSFRQAIIAFQKVEQRPRTGKLTAIELQVLRQARPPEPLETGPFHIEIDLDRQIVMVVAPEGVVIRTVSTSTGSGERFTEGGRTRRAITPTGRFQIRYKVPGWRTSPLGRLYYPLYFFDGAAIHGSLSIPIRPASHGCVRLPMSMAREFYHLVPSGTPVLIYSILDLPDGSTVSDSPGQSAGRMSVGTPVDG
ncbi:MAG: L,D-transpeptidase family protein [Blastocatellia bacterium]